MNKEVKRPIVQALGLSLDYYRQTMPGYIQRLEEQFQRFLAEIKPHADICGANLCCSRQEVEAAVKQAVQNNADALLLIPLSYMQECNPALARKDRKVRLIRKEFWTPGIKPYVGMHFTLEPGQVTLCNLTTDQESNFYTIVAEADIMDMPPFKNLDIPHWVVKLQEPVGDFLTHYSMAGGTHHLAAVPGKRSSAIQKLAALHGWKSYALST